MNKITTHLWYDTEAKDAVALYASTFPDSKVKDFTTLNNTPSGDTDIVNIELMGLDFTLISAGPAFKFTSAISFIVMLDKKEAVDDIYHKLVEGGKTLMELDSYPFSERYAWVEDKYGLSWQLMYMTDRKIEQRILPTLMFTDKVYGKAEEAIQFYTSVFKNAKTEDIMRYEKGKEPDQLGTIKHANFILENQWFAAMDSARVHNSPFTEAISFIVHCKDQAEIDYYWDKLSAVPESEQCGWLKDKYGVSWQIIPDGFSKLMSSKDEDKKTRVIEAFLKMKKIDIAELERAFEG